MISLEKRPLKYSDVVGQAIPKLMLKNILKSKDMPKALVFAGPSGIGKTTLARIFTRAVLCKAPEEDGSPCNSCNSCKKHINEAHPNYIEVDAANNSGKEDMANLKEKLSFESDGTVFILLDESQNISKSGKDVLLKLLETTGKNDFTVIFCTTEPVSLPGTLSSRSIRIPVKVPSDTEIAARLTILCKVQGYKYEDEALSALATSACGNVRGAEQSLSSVALIGDITLENAYAAAATNLALISKGICALGRNLADSLNIFDEALALYGVEAAYRGMMQLLVDAARYGASLEKYEAPTAAKEIWKLLPKKVPNLLDYIVTRQKFEDPYLFRSDIVVMHTRYLKGEIIDVELDQRPVSSDPKAKKTSIEETDDPWASLDKVRELRSADRKEKLKGSAPDKMAPGLAWGPEVTNAKPNTLRRS